MPRYYYNVHDGVDVIDREGTVLANDAEARARAIIVSSEILKEYGAKFWEGESWQMHVFDEAGKTICKFSFCAEPA